MYSNASLQQLYAANGGSAADAPTMAAIAQAESGGVASQVNMAASEGPGGSWGLWQIDETYWPQFSTSSLLDPNYNAAAAAQVKAQQGFTAWSTYNSGAYRQYLTSSSAGSSSGAPASTNAVQGSSIFTMIVQSSDNPFVLLQNWIASPSVNVLYKAFGFVFVLMVLAAIPQTSRFSFWAALSVLVLLLIQPAQTSTSTLAANVTGGASAPLA